jgi:hypothetical protein
LTDKREALETAFNLTVISMELGVQHHQQILFDNIWFDFYSTYSGNGAGRAG